MRIFFFFWKDIDQICEMEFFPKKTKVLYLLLQTFYTIVIIITNNNMLIIFFYCYIHIGFLKKKLESNLNISTKQASRTWFLWKKASPILWIGESSLLYLLCIKCSKCFFASTDSQKQWNCFFIKTKLACLSLKYLNLVQFKKIFISCHYYTIQCSL